VEVGKYNVLPVDGSDPALPVRGGAGRRGTWVCYWLVPAARERMSALLSLPLAANAAGS
jgi:hypothetical protein